MNDINIPSSPKLSRKLSMDARSPQSPRSPRKSAIKTEVASPSDRFIPSRRGIDFEVSKYYLNNEIENDGYQYESATSSSFQHNHQESEFEHHLRVSLLESPNSLRKKSSFNSPSQPNNMIGSPTSPSRGLKPRVLNFSLDASSLSSPTSLSSSTSSLSDSLDNSIGFHSMNNLQESGRKKTPTRVIQSAPSRILDAPDIVDDYYLNLISWSGSNVLAVALGPSIYTWNADKNSVQQICTLEHGNIVTSVSWSHCGGQGQELLAVGCNSSEIQIWDTISQKLVRTLPGHTARVSSLSWNPTSSQVLSSGSRDSTILNHDLRLARQQSSSPLSGLGGGGVYSGIVSTLRGHKQEVCGLKWNQSGNTLASGGNENYLCLWDVASSGRNFSSSSTTSSASSSMITPRLTLTDHKAAVKALAWAPFKSSLLASGGGTADRCIKYWNIHTGNLVSSTDTGSQVCSLLWSPNRKEIVSGHGFSQNQLVLWKYPTMSKLMEFTGHTARVLHLDQSPDGASVVSAGADETLRFWKIFGSSNNKSKSNHSASLTSFETMEPMSIR